VWARGLRSEGGGIGRGAQRFEKGEVFEFCCLPRGRCGSRSGGEGYQILCRLCECLLSWGGVGYGDAHIIWNGGPICGCDKRFDEGVIIVYGGKKGLKSMRF
jgi:hypothetical protein